MPDKNRSGALNSMQRATKRKRYGREVERATRDATETGQMRSPASNERRNGNGTDGKSSEKHATQRNGSAGKEWAGNEVRKNYVSRPQRKLNQTT